ncbi:MAG TPA: AraC family transcriptional regulator [Bryobacteraceae bacterium]|jgi:AraC family transcriptional regulator|nr:AraC family transcriptional regulator [Bryobacteraceae bacterium]
MSGDTIPAPVGSELYGSSKGLNWSGIEVRRYRVPAGESKEHSFPQLVVFLSHVERPIDSELRISGRRVRALIGNQTVSIAPPGLPLSTRRDGPGEVTAIYLNAGPESNRVLPQYWIQDPLIHAIGTALEEELAKPGPSSASYAEALGAALVAHIFARYSDPNFDRQPAATPGATQSAAQIARALDFIGRNVGREITLDELAEVANMSKFHFAKSFRKAMGIAPHQYLVKLRVEKARKLLALQTMSVEEVAGRVGYLDKAHFAAQFRKIVGISPNRYREHS